MPHWALYLIIFLSGLPHFAEHLALYALAWISALLIHHDLIKPHLPQR